MVGTRPAHRRRFKLGTARLAAVALVPSPSWAGERASAPPAIDVFDTTFNATGTLTTTVDGRTYTQPANGT